MNADNEPGFLPEYESGVRRMVYDGRGIPYQAVRPLAEVKVYDDGIVVLEGDDGGQIYAVSPASLVACTQDTLEQLLRDVDALEWNDPSMARVFYERQPADSPVSGGMGGGWVLADEIWVHDRLVQKHLDVAIRAVIRGQRPRLDVSRRD